MLAQLKGLFTPEAIAASLESLPPLETTVMDNLFKVRPTHPLPLIGISELKAVVQSVPVVRRDGTPVSLKGEGVDMEFVAPLPIKVQIPVSARLARYFREQGGADGLAHAQGGSDPPDRAQYR